jgi:hypothetical protein
MSFFPPPPLFNKCISHSGHLVTDLRPPTVLNVLLPREQEGQPRSFRLPAAATAATRMQQGRDAPNSAAVSSLAPAARELDQLSAQLRDKTKDLLAANLSQTKLFFRKLKKYIDFLSTPSETVEECRCVCLYLLQCLFYSLLGQCSVLFQTNNLLPH